MPVRVMPTTDVESPMVMEWYGDGAPGSPGTPVVHCHWSPTVSRHNTREMAECLEAGGTVAIPVSSYNMMRNRRGDEVTPYDDHEMLLLLCPTRARGFQPVLFDTESGYCGAWHCYKPMLDFLSPWVGPRLGQYVINAFDTFFADGIDDSFHLQQGEQGPGYCVAWCLYFLDTFFFASEMNKKVDVMSFPDYGCHETYYHVYRHLWEATPTERNALIAEYWNTLRIKLTEWVRAARAAAQVMVYDVL
jgi:hypothetical protein